MKLPSFITALKQLSALDAETLDHLITLAPVVSAKQRDELLTAATQTNLALLQQDKVIEHCNERAAEAILHVRRIELPAIRRSQEDHDRKNELSSMEHLFDSFPPHI